MIAATLDTNVLASGFLGALIETSTPGELLRRWYQQGLELILSDPVLAELTRTFEQPYFTRRMPVSFFIVTLSCAAYLLAQLVAPYLPQPRAEHSPSAALERIIEHHLG